MALFFNYYTLEFDCISNALKLINSNFEFSLNYETESKFIFLIFLFDKNIKSDLHNIWNILILIPLDMTQNIEKFWQNMLF